MSTRSLYLLLLFAQSNALRVLPSAGNGCTITFSPHSGFGNELYAALGAGYIAKIVGCKLVLPPIVQTGGPDHTKLAYGSENKCMKGAGYEKSIVGKASKIVEQASLKWNQIFTTTPLVSNAPLGSLAKREFLPVHCSLWKQMGEDETKFAAYLKEIIQKKPNGDYVIGSGYNSGAPRVMFNELFDGFTPQMQKALADGQSNIAAKTGNKEYACLHLRSGDAALKQDVHDDTLKQWVTTHLAKLDKPLLIASAETKGSIDYVLKDTCSRPGVKCILTSDIMPSGNYGLPTDTQKIMLLEIAMCGKAKEVYLPHSVHKIVNGQKISAPAGADIFRSTFSDSMSDIALWDNPKENTNHHWKRPV